MRVFRCAKARRWAIATSLNLGLCWPQLWMFTNSLIES
jgi:hypothetical protein